MEIATRLGYRCRMLARSISALLLLLCLQTVSTASECVNITDGMRSMTKSTITLLNNQGKPISLNVLVADDDRERGAGFQHICPEVIDKTLILFVYPSETRGRFHMHNVHAALDIAFFDRHGALVKQELMKTYSGNSTPLYGPKTPFQFALEARQGYFAELDATAFPSQLLFNP